MAFPAQHHALRQGGVDVPYSRPEQHLASGASVNTGSAGDEGCFIETTIDGGIGQEAAGYASAPINRSPVFEHKPAALVTAELTTPVERLATLTSALEMTGLDLVPHNASDARALGIQGSRGKEQDGCPSDQAEKSCAYGGSRNHAEIIHWWL